MNNFKEGQAYIVARIRDLKDTWNSYSDLKKIKILEITALTIFYKNLDNIHDSGVRMLTKDFNNLYKIVEIIDNQD